MSGFYEVTTASGCGGGRRVHEKAPVWAGCCVSHPAADRTLTGASDAAAPSPSPLALRARYEGDGPTALTESAGTAKLHSCRINPGRAHAAAARGPVLDHLIHGARRQHLAPASFVAGLASTLSPRRVLARPRWRGRRVGAWWLRAIARVAIQPALELGDPLILACDPLLESTDLLVHAQQHRHHDLAALVVDRLRLSVLHA